MGVRCAVFGTFNRTNLELKLVYSIIRKIADKAFNRTNLELKQWIEKNRPV